VASIVLHPLGKTRSSGEDRGLMGYSSMWRRKKRRKTSPVISENGIDVNNIIKNVEKEMWALSQIKMLAP
jgi:hypothetical protein